MAAGGTPRQRMINLMYLVFIAMLALNMSKEVLSAFGLLNEKFESSIEKAEINNTQYLLSLQQKSTENPEKFGPLYEKGLNLQKAVSVTLGYLEKLKSEMLSTIDDPMDYEVMDNSDFLDSKFFNGESLTDEGNEFLSQLQQLKSQLIELVPNGNISLIETINQRFETGDANNETTNREGQSIGWLNYHYEGFPLIASLTKITSIQSDIKTSEQEILQSLLEGQLTKEVSMTNYTTLLEQSKGAYFSEDTFDGSIVLGRKDATTRPNEVELKLDGRNLQFEKDFFIEDGRVRLAVPAGNPGDHSLEGVLIFIENGEETRVPIDASFATISKPNTAIVSADKMNVVYRGVENPLTISIPGVANNKVRASANGLVSRGGSSYILKPSSGTYSTITVTGELPDGSQIKTSTQFRIKDVPAPTGTIRGEYGNLRMSRAELEKTIVGAVLLDFDFDLPFDVTGFKIKIPDQPTVEVKGNRMDSRAVAAIRRATRGDIIQIFEIKTKPIGESYFLKPASAVIVEIIN
jgi:gliding motility-associated protein GldM